MPVETLKLGGYWFDVATARTLSHKLGIDDKDASDERLDRAVNNWLVGKNMTNILAGSIMSPQALLSDSDKATRIGMIICTQFRHRLNSEISDTTLLPLEEGESDKEVREWLVTHGVREPRWVTILDTMGLTRGGIRPRIREVNPRIGVLTEEQYMMMMWPDEEKRKQAVEYEAILRKEYDALMATLESSESKSKD